MVIDFKKNVFEVFSKWIILLFPIFYLKNIYVWLCVYVCVVVLLQPQWLHQSYDMALFMWALWAFTWSSEQRKKYWHEVDTLDLLDLR